ncbi:MULTISPECIES: cell division protein ZipA [Halomonadaceae]|uniref:Cell division protein ZipA n=2 Tax=Vreelandella TaxID=3137766 RepID=A0A7Z0LUU5_9GAMM|nr:MULTISPECIES: cell division protein ZipA [Halomonas]NYS78880.1 cell division protein ZipA [Halomonas glaciei]|tara:strand:- start:1916 stop:3778 length:1863 start_codon:yes stop_codon:yes gene_type:complete
MELREWLIILGLALVSLIVIDGARRLQRQRRVPRLDQAEKDLSASQLEDDPDEAAKAAEINWELPNGGARVVKPADYSGLGHKPKLERQEHPGPSRVLSEFRRSASAKAAKRKAAKAESIANSQSIAAEKTERPVVAKANTATTSPSMPTEHERLEPSISMANTSMNSTSKASTLKAAEVPQDKEAVSQYEAEPTAAADSAAMANATASNVNAEATEPAPQAAIKEGSTTREAAASPDDMSIRASETDTEASVQPDYDAEPVLRAEPEDAVFAKHANDHSPKRRQLRSDTAGDHDELDDDEVDEYRLVDFEGMGRSLKRRLIERRKEKQRKKAEKALRDKALAKQKAERKAVEAEQRREAKEAADAERARVAQEQAQAREEAAANAAAADRLAAQQRADDQAREASRYEEPLYEEGYSADFDENADYASDTAYDDRAADERGGNDSVRIHPTLEKALRHDVSGEHAKETLSSAEEVVVISVLSRDPEGFDGSKLLELMMVCGLRYSREMGIFHRFETESDDSELQFSMVNVVKPGTFPIEEMGEFMTPGITLLMPLPGALDSAAAFEAMVETAMVVVRHMGGELKDENRSVMTAQTIEFARQRVREFERRHRLHRHMQVR